MGRLDARIRQLVATIDHEAAVWREEPVRRIAARNGLMRPLRVRQFRAFGEKSIVDRPHHLYGARHMAIGDRVVVLRDGWLSVERVAWESDPPVLVIGNDVAIRVGCTISAAESVIIEDHVLMGARVSIVDSNHTWRGGHPNALYNPVETRPIRVGRGSWLADKVTVVAGADIGEQCAIGANSVVRGAIPDFSVAVGSPARVIGSTRA